MIGGPVFLRPQRLIYVRAEGPYETSVPRAWSELLGWIDRNDFSSLVSSWYGLARDNPLTAGREKCRYDACVPVDPMFEERALRELALNMLPGGPYARHKLKSDPDAVISAVQSVFGTFSAEDGMQFDPQRPVVTIYLGDPRGEAGKGLRADVCVPVEAQRASRKDKAAA